MKGVVKYAKGPGLTEVRDMPVPDMKPAHAKIAIEAAGICGTDLHIYADEYPSVPPVIIGHEFAGTIIDIDDSEDFHIGDRVTGIPTSVVCGTCRYCVAGQLSLCETRLSIGSGIHGTYTKYLVVPVWTLRKLPEHIDMHTGALSEPLCCCVKAVSMLTDVKAGDIAVVTGPGPIGLLTAQVARQEGAYVILTGTSVDAERLKVGAQWSDQIVNIEETDLNEVVHEATGGYGADLVFECSGSAAATRSAISLVRKQGTIMQIGLHGSPFEIDFFAAELKEISIKTSFAGSIQAWDRTMALLNQKKIDPAPVVSDILPLTDWKVAFDRLGRKEGMKILLAPVD